MGVSTATVTVTDTMVGGKTFQAFGTIAVSASSDTYASNGLTLDFTADPLCKATRVPLMVRIQGQAKVNSQTQYGYTYVPGTDASDGKMKIFTGGAEVSAGAMPAGVSGDTIQFEAIFRGQN